MRVLVANWRDTSHPRAGGAEVYTEEVCVRLVEAGHEVTWFSAAHPGAGPEDVHRGIRRVRRGGTYSVYREGRRFAETHRAHFDVLVDQVNTVPFRLDRVAGETPVCYLSHQLCREIWNTDMPLPAALLGRYVAEPWWLSQMRKMPTATVSPSSAAELERAGFGDIVNLGEGIDRGRILAMRASRGAGAKTKHPTALYLGRHAANKRPMELARAGMDILTAVEGAQLWFAGAGPELERVRGEAAKLNRIFGEGAVKVFGRVSEERKLELMEQAWCLVVPSVREGWALVVDEAAAVGTRSVGYPVPGLVDSIPAAGGVLTAKADYRYLGLAVADTLLSSGELAGKVVEGWEGGAESWETVTARFERYLESVVENPQLSPGRQI